MLPSIIETIGKTKKGWDIPTKLYNDSNIITVFGEFDDDLAYSVITQLLYLDSIKSEERIKLYINSPGGSVTAGLAIIDTINLMKRKVDTVGMGCCASMGAVLLFAATGERKSLPNNRIMIHSVSSGTGGVVHDQVIQLNESVYLQDVLMDMIAKYSKGTLTKEQVIDMTQRDKFMSSEEAKELNLIDTVL